MVVSWLEGTTAVACLYSMVLYR